MQVNRARISSEVKEITPDTRREEHRAAQARIGSSNLQHEHQHEKNLDAGDIAQVEEGIKIINGAMKVTNKRLNFQVHEATERILVRVIDAATEEVIKEIPPEEVLDVAARIHEMIGLLLDEKA